MGNSALRTAAAVSLLLAIMSSCAPKGGGAPTGRDFPSVEIPSMYSEPGQRLEYGLTHFWDGFFSRDGKWPDDSLHFAGVDKSRLEENFALFSGMLARASVELGDRVMTGLFDKVAGFRQDSLEIRAGEEIVRLADKYLYDPSSPLRCEDAYYCFVSALSRSDIVPESMRRYYETAAANCSMNRRGTVAADFTFTDADGRTRHLHDVTAPVILIKIQNLGCTACKELQAAMEESPKIQYLISCGTLFQIDVPSEGDIEKVYDVRAIPSLYLLDSEKRVLAKDASSEFVLDFLENYRD